MKEAVFVSVVVPILNEELCIPELYRRLEKQLSVYRQWQILFVDDGSHDSSIGRMKQICRENPNVGLIRLSRNFGHQSALLAGILAAKGDVVISLDGDLQHPPEVIPQFIDQYLKGYHVVQGIRTSQNELPFFKRVFSQLFYRVFSFLTKLPMQKNSGDFRLLSRKVIEELRKLSESELFLRGMISWLGFPSIELLFEQEARFQGERKYTWKKMFLLGVNAVTSFTIKPIRVAILFSALSFLIAFVYLAYALYAKYMLHQVVSGWTSLVFLFIVFQSVQFLLMGVLGEYIGRTYEEVKSRPRYIVLETENVFS